MSCLDGEAIALATRSATDMRAWQGGVYSFLLGPAIGAQAAPAVARPWPPPSPQEPAGLDTRSMAERCRRVAEITAWLVSHPELPAELRSATFTNLASCYLISAITTMPSPIGAMSSFPSIAGWEMRETRPS